MDVGTGLTTGIGSDHRHSLSVNFSWNLAGKVIFSASQLGVLVVLARLGSVSMVGQYALGLAIAAPVMLFAQLGARTLLASEHAFAFGFRDYLSLLLISLPAAVAVVGAIAVVAGYPVGTLAVVVAIAVAKLVSGLSEICYGAAQWSERMRQIGLSLAVRGLLSVAAMTALVWATRSAAVGAAGVAVAWAMVLVLYDLPRAKEALHLTRGTANPLGSWPLGTNTGRQRLRRLFLTAIPLGITAPLMSLQVNVPRYAVEGFLGTEELGIFAALGYVLVVGNTTVMALGHPVLPRLARYVATGHVAEFRRLLAKLAAFGAALGLGGALLAWGFGVVVLDMLYGAEYAGHNDVLVWLFVGAAPAFAGSFLYQGVMAVREIKTQPFLYGLNVVVVSAASLLLVPRAGLVGAAWAYGAAMLLQFFGVLLLVRRGLRRRTQSSAPESPASGPDKGMMHR